MLYNWTTIAITEPILVFLPAMNVKISAKIKRGTFVASKFIDPLLVPPPPRDRNRVQGKAYNSHRKSSESPVIASDCD
jgi:hypothetical protein